MKLEQLKQDNVRFTRRVAKITVLSEHELRRAAGANHVPPEICAIHDYYIEDALA